MGESFLFLFEKKDVPNFYFAVVMSWIRHKVMYTFMVYLALAN